MACMMGGGIGLREAGVFPDVFVGFFYTGLGCALASVPRPCTSCANTPASPWARRLPHPAAPKRDRSVTEIFRQHRIQLHGPTSCQFARAVDSTTAELWGLRAATEVKPPKGRPDGNPAYENYINKAYHVRPLRVKGILKIIELPVDEYAGAAGRR